MMLLVNATWLHINDCKGPDGADAAFSAQRI